jgi:hypothetical protein
VVEVEAKCTHGDNIEKRNVPYRECSHHVLVNGEMFELPRPEPDDTAGQVQKVKNDEGKE